MFRSITFIARTLRTIDSWPDYVRDIVKLNLQSLQNNQVFKKKFEGADKAAINTIDGRWKRLKADRKAKRI